MSEPKGIKRSRRRKYPKPNEEGSSYILLNERTNQNIAGGNDANVPPGFEPIVGNKNCEKDQENGSNDLRVGQVVSALIEGEFEGGFWVSVRDDNSNTMFRGQIFKTKPPHAHVTLDNNVAQRNVVPLPDTRNEKHVTDSNETLKKDKSSSIPKGASSSSNLVNSSGKNVPRGKNISKDANQDSLFGTSLGRGTSLRKKRSIGGNQAPSSQTQARQSMLPLQSENILRYLSSEKVVDETVREITKHPTKAFDFENLVNEVAKRIVSCSNSTSQVIDSNDHLPKQQ